MAAKKHRSRSRALGAIALVSILPLMVACVSRAAPFNELNDASVTVLRLQPYQAPAAVPGAQPGGGLIPGLPVPPELQQQANQILQGWQQYLPPGTIPGAPGATPTQPAQPRLHRDRWAIAGHQQVMDEALKQELLDIFGDSGSFQAGAPTCSNAEMSVIFQSPSRPEPVEVVVSLQCSQVEAYYGLQWPHAGQALTAESHQSLSSIYQQLFGGGGAQQQPGYGTPSGYGGGGGYSGSYGTGY